MNIAVKIFIGLALSLTVVWLKAMETKEEAAIASSRTIYLKNCSKYDVRVEVGPEYPNAISLLPQQIIEFPLSKMKKIVASSYGMYACCKSGVSDSKSIDNLLQNNPDCAEKDCLVTINFEEGQSLISTYLITQGKWIIGFKPVSSEQDIASYYCDGSFNQDVYKVVAQISGSHSEALKEQAALVWSMFSRAEAKLANKLAIYPFHILGLDIGGTVPSHEQLENWHGLLINSLRKKWRTVVDSDIWNAVNMIIAGAITSYKRHQYYENLDPNSPSSLIKSFKSSSASNLLASVPNELIKELKEWIGENSRAQEIIKQIEDRLNGRSAHTMESTIPQPPPPPPLNKQHAGSCYEKVIVDFVGEVAHKPLEEQLLIDKVALTVFEKIDCLNATKLLATRLKYGALSQLRTIDQNVQGRNPVNSLTKIMEFMTPAMISLAREDPNPLHAIQDWLEFLARTDREKCTQCKSMEGEKLLQVFMLDKKANDTQLSLIVELKKQFDRYQQLDSDLVIE